MKDREGNGCIERERESKIKINNKAVGEILYILLFFFK